MEEHYYPYTFRPVFKQVVWGGRKLQTVLNKPLPPEQPVGESWEVSTHSAGVSVISNGPLEGTPLPEAIDRLGASLVGTQVFQQHGTTFPLLIKFIDAKQMLSVQVHPNAKQAAALGGEPKTEAWVILDTEPGAALICGVLPGTTGKIFREKLAAGCVAECLNRFEVHPGDVIFIPAGTIHAIGKGIVLAEIQQNSDTTYRLFDWDRVDLNGQQRPLHLDEALQVSDFSPRTANTETPVDSSDAYERHSLVECELFSIRSWEVASSTAAQVDPERFEIVLILDGDGTIDSATGSVPIAKGTTVLLPAALGHYTVRATTPLKMIWTCPL